MYEQFSGDIEAYLHDWHGFVAERSNQAFFAALVPLSASWKVADEPALMRAVQAIMPLANTAHATRKNDRWLWQAHLLQPLPANIGLISIMQRRPGSPDRLGLDNLNFYCPDMHLVETELIADPAIRWTRESNGPHSHWLSIWFGDDREAKIRPECLMDVDIREFRDTSDTYMKEHPYVPPTTTKPVITPL